MLRNRRPQLLGRVLIVLCLVALAAVLRPLLRGIAAGLADAAILIVLLAAAYLALRPGRRRSPPPPAPPPPEEPRETRGNEPPGTPQSPPPAGPGPPDRRAEIEQELEALKRAVTRERKVGP